MFVGWADRVALEYWGPLQLVALTYWVHPYFVWFTVFVGVNLFQQSFTGFCPATMILRKVFGFKTEKELASN